MASTTKTKDEVKKTETPTPEDKALTTQSTQAIAAVEGVDMSMLTGEAPSISKDFERITRDEMAIPRLCIAQKTSPELEPGDRLIEGLAYTHLFHSADKRNWKTGPLLFAVVKRFDPRFIEFRPMDEGGGILDMNVHPNDPRTQFTTDDEGNRIKPRAMKFLDYIIVLLNGFDPADPMKNVMALSLKSTGLKAAKELNRLIAWRGPREMYAGVYKVTPGTDKNKQGQGFAIYKFENAGWLKEGTAPHTVARDIWASLKDIKEVNIEREPGQDDEFDPEEIERETAAAGGRRSDPGM